MDFGKFRYQQEKKQKEAKKKQKVIDIKEIKLSVKIAQNDINYKVRHALEFLEQGKFVKFRVFLKGREMQNPSAGVALLEKVWQSIEDKASREKEPNFEGRYVNMLVTPKKVWFIKAKRCRHFKGDFLQDFNEKSQKTKKG